MNTPKSRLSRYLPQAERLAAEPDKLKTLLGRAGAKLAGSSNAQLLAMKEQLTLALALLKDWVSGSYRQIQTRTVATLVAGVLYFVLPLDAVPDFLLGWGMLDDIAVLGYVFAQLREELAAYASWRDRQRRPNPAPSGTEKQESERG